MTDEEWEERRRRAILAAFQTGRPVFADTDGVLRYTDGSKEQVPTDVGVAKPAPRSSLAVRAERASRRTFVLSTVAAIANAFMAVLWNPPQIVLSVLLAVCAVVWYRVNRQQRAALAKGAV